jgi:hypothetical protein
MLSNQIDTPSNYLPSATLHLKPKNSHMIPLKATKLKKDLLILNRQNSK